MQELLGVMSSDMNISEYYGEPMDNFAYRVIYSALGLWCLKVAQRSKSGGNGVSKNAQTLVIHDLLEKYIGLYPEIERFFSARKNTDVAIFIRTVYEQTGYLMSTEGNHCVLAMSEREICLSTNKYLFFGIPDGNLSMNGFGVFTDFENENVESLQDFLIRDNLSTDEYVEANYDICDFEPREIDESTLEFFDPKMRTSPSKAWQNYMEVDLTMARQGLSGPYFRIMRDSEGQLLFADEFEGDKGGSFTGYEYRRLYMALNDYYGSPMLAYLCPIDEIYSHIRFLGHLPNREYYLMLLCGWPKYSIEDKTNFIIKNEMLPALLPILKNIGVNVKRGEFRG